jgi:hypothetical protein
MATTLAAQVRAIITGNWDNGLDLSTVRDALSQNVVQELTNGTGANKGQVQWHDERSLATESENLDLTALAGGAFGTVTFTKIKWLIIQVETVTPTVRIEMGAAGGNDWAGSAQLLKDASDIIRLCAGGLYLFTSPVDGWVVDSDQKVLKMNAIGTLTYKIMIIGEGTVA